MSLFCWTQRKICWRKFVIRLFWGTIDFHSRKKNTMEVNGAPELLSFPHSSEYLPLCSAEQRHSYRIGTTWGWVNDDRIFIFGWTIPLTGVNMKLNTNLHSWINKDKISFASTKVHSASLQNTYQWTFQTDSRCSDSLNHLLRYLWLAACDL